MSFWISFLTAAALSVLLILVLLTIWLLEGRKDEPQPHLWSTTASTLPPASLSKPTSPIADMHPGESAYTVPWAMESDEEERFWLRGDYDAYADPGGMVLLHLERRDEGFLVDLERSDDLARNFLRKTGCTDQEILAAWKAQAVVELRS